MVFNRELVPRRAIALILWENYIAVPMKHEIEHVAAPASGGQLLHPSGDVVSKSNDRSSWATHPVDATSCLSGAERVDHNLKVEYSWRRGRNGNQLRSLRLARRNIFQQDRTRNLSSNIIEVTLLFAAAASNIELNIPAGKFGMQQTSS